MDLNVGTHSIAKSKDEPLVEVYEVKEVVKPEILEAVDAVDEEDMQEVLSMKSVTPICEETQEVSDEDFACVLLPEFEKVCECKEVGMLSFGTLC